jgi:hypothetical protein
MRWETAARTSKNHPIYLFNYVHGMLAEGTSGANADKPFATIKTNLDAIGAKWIGAGYSDGTNTYKRAGPNGANGTSYLTATYLIDHDLSPR